MSSIRITLPLALVWYRNRPPAQPQPDRASAPTLAASAVPEEGFDTFAMDGLQSANEARQMPGVLALAGRFLSGLMPTVVVSHGGAVATSNTGPDNTAEPQEGVGLQGGLNLDVDLWPLTRDSDGAVRAGLALNLGLQLGLRLGLAQPEALAPSRRQTRTMGVTAAPSVAIAAQSA